MFKAKDESTIDIGFPECEEEIKAEVSRNRIQNETDEATPGHTSGAASLNDIADEFFDVPEPSDDEEGWPSNTSPDSCYVVFLTLGFKLFPWSKPKLGFLRVL